MTGEGLVSQFPQPLTRLASLGTLFPLKRGEVKQAHQRISVP
jgi:hypothetical protein